jgi:Raf kinase inhibitor-like YbhB/YbcL family protein
MGRRFGGQDGSGDGGVSRAVSLAGVAVCLCAVVVIAGCGEGSGGGSASVASTTTAATTATGPTTPSTPTTPTTPATTSTAAKPPASKSSNSSTTTTKSTTTPSQSPAAKSSTEQTKPVTKEKTFGKIKVTSTAFKVGGPIAVKYTCDGAGISPPLQWQGVPKGTAEVFVLAIDLSGGSRDVVQWAIAGIPPTTTSIPEGSLPAGAVAGVNSAGKVGWGGICGAKGQLHHVGFLFYALKRKLALKSGFNPIEVRGGLKGVTLATGLTLATHQRH